MQIVRGAGGIRGIPPVNGNVIRPLLDVNREEILEYCRRHGLAYCIDSTNDSTDYSRNWVRNFLLPQIESNLNPSVGDALGRLAKISAQEDVFLRDIAENAYEKCVKCGEYVQVINLGILAQYDMVIKRRVVRGTLGKALGGLKDITYRHIESVLTLTGAQSGKRVSLPNGFIAEKVYHEICIRKLEIIDSFSVTLRRNIPIYVPQIEAWVHLGDGIVRENAFTKALDCGKITDVHIRTRLAGDRIYFNNVGTKKIKDFFTDKKIAPSQREKAVFIACGGDIILIMGRGSPFEKPVESHKFEPKDNGKTIYLQIWNN
jgi:tRNA(Ile)-lysidine synthase